MPATSCTLTLLTSANGSLLDRVVTALGSPDPVVVNDLNSLCPMPDSVLFSFAHSMIVPGDVLRRFPAGAYNLHAASPAYPGRDPHNWAIYEGAREYGATLHVMTDRVDEGPIVDVEMFPVSTGHTPLTLLDAANDAAARICARVGKLLQRGERLLPLAGICWSGKKRTRADLHAICRVPIDIPRDEFKRRLRAFGGSYRNLTVTVHDKTFRIEDEASDPARKSVGG